MADDKMAFTIADSPADTVPDKDNPFSDEPKPKRTRAKAPTTGASRDVKTAMSALTNAHNILSFGFMIASPSAAEIWEAEREDLDARNLAILEADPALAKRIANMASKGGGFALVMSHGIAILPAIGTMRIELQAKREARYVDDDDEPEYNEPMPTPAATAAPQPTVNGKSDKIIDPDFAFKR